MSTVLSHPVSFQPAGYVDAACIGCSTALSVPADSVSPLCRICQRGQALADISRLLADVRNLREGRGVFAGLTREERSEQLEAVGLPSLDATPRFPGFRTMSDEQLIDIAVGNGFCIASEAAVAVAEAVVELARRLEGWTPTPQEQQHLEQTSLVLAGEPEDPERWDLV